MRQSSQAWAFSSKPKALGASSEEVEMVCNIMSDPRVMRGSTRVRRDRNNLASEAVEEKSSVARKRRSKPRRIDRIGAVADTYYREEIKEKPDLSRCLEEQEASPETHAAECQTGPFLELSEPLPAFTSSTTNHQSVSTSTQGLFCFDREADPIVNVLVGKTLEQALLEVRHEEEYSALIADNTKKNRVRQDELEKIESLTEVRMAELAMKNAEIEKASLARRRRILLEKKVASYQLMNVVVPSVFEECFKYFEERGQWVDPLVRDIRKNFLPDLYTSVSEEYQRQLLGRDALDDLLRDILS